MADVPNEPLTGDDCEPTATYVFRAELRLDPERSDLRVEPSTVAVTIEREADSPGEPGWRFFRDNLWRGELADVAHFRELTEGALGIRVESVMFSEFRTTDASRRALRGAVAADLESFNAESVEVLSKYLGSSIRVTDDIP